MAPNDAGEDPFAFLARAEARHGEELMPEQRIDGRWIIKTRIGRGAFGVVFEVERVGQPRDYAAVKIVPPDPGGDPRWARRFIQEADVTVGLRHPNIVDTREHGELADGSRYLVMELLDGETLAERLRDGRGLAWAELAAMVEQLGAALAAVHRAGIVHRDVKPANLFLLDIEPPGAWVKLIDFGLCKGPAAITASRERLGTLAYMAPEILLHGSPSGTAAIDVYAMAVSTYEAVTGSRAFVEAELPALLSRICRGPGPAPMAERRSDVPADLDRMIAAGLDPDPERRPRDAAAYGRALAAVIRAQGVVD